MGFTTAAINALLDAWDDGLAPSLASTHISLHDGFPGDTAGGANEISGGAPAYARQTISYNAASARNLDSSTQPTFDVPAAAEVQYIGAFTAVTAGTMTGWTLAGAGVVQGCTIAATGDLVTSYAHGYSNDDRVAFFEGPGAVPTGLTEGTIYHVISSTTDTFQVSTSQGGAAVTITADGECVVQQGVPETFGAQGTYQVTDLDWSLTRG